MPTGNWTTLSFDGRQRVGVSQLLQRSTFFTAMSQFRRISSSIKPEQKLSKPRYIHGTHRGRLCFIESPEGASCGLESQLSVGAYISIASPVELLQDLIEGHPGDELVFINGALQGRYSLEVVDIIRAARRSGCGLRAAVVRGLRGRALSVASHRRHRNENAATATAAATRSLPLITAAAE